MNDAATAERTVRPRTSHGAGLTGWAPAVNAPFGLPLRCVSFRSTTDSSRGPGMFRRWIAGLAAASLSVGGVVAVAPVALAAPKPSVTLTMVNNQVTAGQPTTIRYLGVHLPSGSTLYLQRQVGTAHVWRTTQTLHGIAGTTVISGEPMGIQHYRIVIYTKKGFVTLSATRGVYFYGNVSMLTICQTAQVGGDGCSNQTEVVGTMVLAFVTSAFTAAYPNYSTALNNGSTTCRAVTVEFASNDGSSITGVSYAEILQASADAETATTPAQTIGTLRASLNGGPWYLNTSNDNGDGVAVNGTFSCYTPTGM
jgi:hypothetical protein